MRNFALFPITLLLLSCSSNESADNTMNVDDPRLAGEGLQKFPCEAIENLLATVEDCADLTAMQKDVKPGPAALDAPASMVRGKTYEVTLVIDRPMPAPPPPPSQSDHLPSENAMAPADNMMDSTSNIVAADANMSDSVDPAEGPSNVMDAAPTANEVAAQLPGRDTHFPAQVGRYMKATLTGAGFEIKPVWPLDGMREIPRGGQGRWQWEVVPKMEGQRRLTVMTQAMGKVDGKTIPLGNGDTSQDVDVTVSWPDRVWDVLVAMPAWIKAVTAIFVALGTFISAVGPVRRAFVGFVSGLFKKRRPRPRE